MDGGVRGRVLARTMPSAARRGQPDGRLALKGGGDECADVGGDADVEQPVAGWVGQAHQAVRSSGWRKSRRLGGL